MEAHSENHSVGTRDSTRLRVLVVDDHPTVRVGMRSLILQAHEDTEIVESGDLQGAMSQLQSSQFHLVFLDMRLPETEGAMENRDVGERALVAIRQMDGPPVVVMSGEAHDRAFVESVMKLGAATFVPKSAPVEVTLDAIRRALAGGVWLPPQLIGKGGATPSPSVLSLRGPLPEPITHKDLGLTAREFDVLRLALNGLTPAKIAATLQINHDNVKKYMGRLYERFGTANQVSLHAYFAKTGQTLGILRSLPKER
jgi:DNA-binding NarL/FixJ family response regulator